MNLTNPITPVLSESDPAWLDAVPKPLLKSMESIGLDDRFFRTLRDVTKTAGADAPFAAATHSSSLRFYTTSVLTLAVAQAVALLPDLGGGDPIGTVLKNHLTAIWRSYSGAAVVGVVWMHVALGLNAITSDWPKIRYREGLRRLLFVFGWGTFYSGLAAAAGTMLGAIASSQDALVLGMISGSVVNVFQFVLIARALHAPWRVHLLAWLFVSATWLFVLAVGVVFVMAALGY